MILTAAIVVTFAQQLMITGAFAVPSAIIAVGIWASNRNGGSKGN